MNNKKILIIAEIGNNHEGNFNAAKELILAAHKAKVDGVKFQIFKPHLYVSRLNKERFDKLKKFQLTKKEYIKLSEIAKDLKLLFFSTPFDLISANFVNKYQNIFKISSGDNNYYDLIKKIASFKKDIIISTGLSDFDNLNRVKKIVTNIWKENNVKKQLFFLHCISEYPTSIENANLSMINKLQSNFPDVNIGYSDHTIGVECCKIAISKGAKIIEKHFTLNKFKNNDFRDHQLSADENEIKEIVKFKNLYLKATKEKNRKNINENTIRRSYAVNKNLRKNSFIKKEDLIFIRPKGEFFKNDDLKKIIGKKIKVNLTSGTHIKKKFLY